MPISSRSFPLMKENGVKYSLTLTWEKEIEKRIAYNTLGSSTTCDKRKMMIAWAVVDFISDVFLIRCMNAIYLFIYLIWLLNNEYTITL